MVDGKTLSYCDSADDIVGFVEEPVKANDFSITQADCQANRKVLLRDGRKATLFRWDCANTSTSYKVDGHIEGTPSLQCWTPTGVFSLSRGVTGNDIVGFVEEAPPCKQMRDLTMEEIGALVGTHNFKLVHNPALIRTIWHNMKHIWEKNNQADILIAPVGTEDWKPMQKEC
jgi:hypothetical protein